MIRSTQASSILRTSFLERRPILEAFVPAVLDKDKGGNAGDSELIGEVNIFVNIYFPYFDVIPFFCHGINSGGEHAAGAAPGSPEIRSE